MRQESSLQKFEEPTKSFWLAKKENSSSAVALDWHLKYNANEKVY